MGLEGDKTAPYKDKSLPRLEGFVTYAADAARCVWPFLAAGGMG
jgi:hypothetical protein